MINFNKKCYTFLVDNKNHISNFEKLDERLYDKLDNINVIQI